LNTYSKLKLNDLLFALEAFAEDKTPARYGGRPTWRSERKRFEGLWLSGLPVSEIAILMERSESAINTMRCVFGLPPRRPQRRQQFREAA